MRSERTALYRLYDGDGTLLYIGISRTFGDRWRSEASAFPWWPQVRRQAVDWHDSRLEAERAERTAIKAEQPKYNVQHNRPVRKPQPQVNARIQERREKTGAAIRHLRESREMSQHQLADEMVRAGFSWYQSTVYRVEHGQQTLFLLEAESIAGIFGLDVDQFCEYRERAA